MYSYYAQEVEKFRQIERFVLIDFLAIDEDADTFDVYISWADLKNLLTLSKAETYIQNANAQAIRNYLGSSKFPQYAAYYKLDEN